jgi:hypothetical protein
MEKVLVLEVRDESGKWLGQVNYPIIGFESKVDRDFVFTATLRVGGLRSLSRIINDLLPQFGSSASSDQRDFRPGMTLGKGESATIRITVE